MSQELDIVIIGAGLSGLSAAIQCALSGHSVTVLEGAAEFAEIGAGLQLTPNSTRILQTWGVYDILKPQACEPSALTVYNYKGKILSNESYFDKNIRQKYGAPFLGCHRSDLQRALVKRAEELGVNIVLNARVIKLDLGASPGDEAIVTTGSGQGYIADLAVGADGLWSICRSTLLGQRDPPRPTGELVYRIVLHIDQICDEKLRDMVKRPACRYWAGPDSHAVAFGIRGGHVLNVVFIVRNSMEEGSASKEGNLDEMQRFLEGWDPILTQLLSCASSVDKWKLMHRPPLDSWTNAHSNLVLIGDSCHPILPYLAQGPNSSVEDGAVLGLLLSPESFQERSQLPSTLRLFENLRKARGEDVARETCNQGRDLHLRDGPEQEQRDRLMLKALGDGVVKAPFPDGSICSGVQGGLYGYDVVKEVWSAIRATKAGPSIIQK